jgi:NAD(P)-dependent dehydrogenase (short-subunit alcohol dehydrogenase family)
MQNLIVIGGSSGIGKAICHKLKDDYQVINMSRRKNDEVENICCDVTKPESVKTAFNELKEKFGIPYGMFYVSGYVLPQSIWELDEATLYKTAETNLLGAFRCTKLFVSLNNEKGKIIYVSSTSALRPSAGWSAYASFKAGLIEFASCMSEELKPNIKVYCVSPGRCNTPLRSMLNNTENKNKIMQADECAFTICQLLNDQGLLDGQNLIIRKISE